MRSTAEAFRLKLDLQRFLPLVAALIGYPAAASDLWDIDDNYVGAAIADAQWTIDESFPGTKLIVDGAFLFSIETGLIPERKGCDCRPDGTRDRILGSVWGHLQWGKGESTPEYGLVAFNVLAFQSDFELSPDERFQPLSDTTEWGVVRLSKDDPLGIDSYRELSIFETAKTWQYRWSDTTPWYMNVGVNLSVGYAWADSTDDRYQDVSNPIIGSWWRGTIGRQAWGRLYIEHRVINGFSFSSPARGGSVSRSAVARFGYGKQLKRCMNLELFVEKRSFNMSDPNLLDLYTKSKRTGVSVSCRF